MIARIARSVALAFSCLVVSILILQYFSIILGCPAAASEVSAILPPQAADHAKMASKSGKIQQEKDSKKISSVE